MDNLLSTDRVGRIALHQNSLSPGVSESRHRFLGLVLAVEVMDRDFLYSFSRQLHGNRPADSPRASGYQRCLKQYLHGFTSLSSWLSCYYLNATKSGHETLGHSV